MRYLALLLTAAVGLSACQDPMSPTAPVDEYSSDLSLTAGSWATVAPMSTARSGLVLAGANARLYAIGGASGNGSSGSLNLGMLEVYDPATNTWTRKLRMPETRYVPSGARYINGVIYVAGGRSATQLRTNTLFAYHIASNTWSRKAPMPVESSCGGSAVYGGMLYVFDGERGMHRYNPATNSWVTLASAPVAHRCPAMGQIGTNVYVATGHDESGRPGPLLHVYSITSNTWSAKASMPEFRAWGAGFALNGKLYVVGGRAPPTTRATNRMLVYDAATDSWSEGPAMANERHFLAVQGVGGKLYAVGGRTSENVPHASVERYTP